MEAPSAMKSSAPLPWVTEVGVATFFLISAMLLVLRNDYDPLHRYISEYAVGWGGWALRVGFGALGLASLNLVPGFFGRQRPERGRRVGWALGTWAVAVVAAAAFPVDLQGDPVTWVGAVHLGAAAVAFAALFAAMVLATRSFRRSPAWQRLTGATHWAAVLTPAAFMLEASVFATLEWFGVGQWLLFGLAGGWLTLLGRHFRRMTGESSRVNRPQEHL